MVTTLKFASVKRRLSFWAALVMIGSLVVSGCASSDAGQASVDVTVDERSTESDQMTAFDSAVVHEIDVVVDSQAYTEMVNTYSETGAKDWIEATVTIDGVTYESAGMKLKGNSSLRGLGGGGFPGFDYGQTATSDTPEQLPWRIRLDKFVKGQTHQGFSEFVIRGNSSETSLNEAVALELMEQVGLASQKAMATRFSVNDSEPVLRLTIQLPEDEAWQDAQFEGSGALFKALSTGNWSYRGDELAEYTEAFEQKSGKKLTDLTPVVEFLKFVNEADDESFASELSERLDIESFATYLAMMEILSNFDAIDGPGNNSYLWWDEASGMFTVVPWDVNMALQGRFGAGFAPGRAGNFPLPEGDAESDVPRPDFQRPEGDADLTPPGSNLEPPTRERPEGFDRNGNPGEVPEGRGFQPPAGGEGFGNGFAGGGPGNRYNALVERFHDTPEFEALYQRQLKDLNEQLIESGYASDLIDTWVGVLSQGAGDLVELATIKEEAQRIRSVLE